MKKLLFWLIICFLALLVLLLIADLLVSSNLRKQQSRMMGGWTDIYSGKIDADIVINGSSRAIYQYNPAILDSILHLKTYNLGIDGSDISRQILKYSTFRRFNHKPRVIIQNIDAFNMIQKYGYEREQFFPYFYDDSLRNAVSQLENLDFRHKYLPFYRYLGYYEFMLQGFGFYKNPTVMNNGFVGNYGGKWNGALFRQQTEIKYAHDSLSLVRFDEYLRHAKDENIDIVFVYAPLYIGAVKLIDDIDGLYAMYGSIAKKYDIQILDYTFDALSYDTAYFYNATHLNGEGADLFSRKLAYALDSLFQNSKIAD